MGQTFPIQVQNKWSCASKVSRNPEKTCELQITRHHRMTHNGMCKCRAIYPVNLKGFKTYPNTCFEKVLLFVFVCFIFFRGRVAVHYWVKGKKKKQLLKKATDWCPWRPKGSYWNMTVWHDTMSLPHPEGLHKFVCRPLGVLWPYAIMSKLIW